MTGRRAFGVAIFLLAGCGQILAERPAARSLAILWTNGAVTIGGSTAVRGGTVLPGDVVTTHDNSRIALASHTLTSATILPNTEIRVARSSLAPGFDLRRGTLVIHSADPVTVGLPGAYVMLKGEGNSGAVCQLAASGGSSTVSVERGVAQIHGAGQPVTI